MAACSTSSASSAMCCKSISTNRSATRALAVPRRLTTPSTGCRWATHPRRLRCSATVRTNGYGSFALDWPGTWKMAPIEIFSATPKRWPSQTRDVIVCFVDFICRKHYLFYIFLFSLPKTGGKVNEVYFRRRTMWMVPRFVSISSKCWLRC